MLFLNMIRKIENLEDLGNIAGSKANFLIYFYNDGCAPCISLRPKVEHLMMEQFPKMDLIYINGLEHPDIVSEYRVFGFPVLIICFEGKEFRRYSKYVSISELGEVIGRVYKIFYEDQDS